MTTRPLTLAALVAAGLVMLTGAYALSHRLMAEDEEPARSVPISTETEAAAAPAPGRCAINHARFGGARAQMFKVTRDGIANYVVMEVSTKRDPLMRFIRNDWLRTAYGETAHATWLGGFNSSDAALAKAAELCPPSLRCLPGDADCVEEARHTTPARVFSGQ